MASTEREKLIRDTWNQPHVQIMARQWNWRQKPSLAVWAAPPSEAEIIKAWNSDRAPAEGVVTFELHMERDINGDLQGAIFSEGMRVTEWMLVSSPISHISHVPNS